MYHTASLTHDDVIDGADLRRGRPSLNRRWGQKKSVYAGCFTMAVANMKVAQLRNDEVMIFLPGVNRSYDHELHRQRCKKLHRQELCKKCIWNT
jgi:geranylgeranyl pyrophosphate synthase